MPPCWRTERAARNKAPRRPLVRSVPREEQGLGQHIKGPWWKGGPPGLCGGALATAWIVFTNFCGENSGSQSLLWQVERSPFMRLSSVLVEFFFLFSDNDISVEAEFRAAPLGKSQQHMACNPRYMLEERKSQHHNTIPFEAEFRAAP